MYEIHFRRNYGTINDRVVVKTGIRSLEEAKNLRFTSGDLVVHIGSHRIVRDPAWLWDWEKKDLNCYAQRAIRGGV